MEKCSYCNTLKEYTEKINGDTIICDSCKEMLNKECKVVVNKKKRKIISPLEIKRKLDKLIVKQESAKEILSIEAYNHLKRSTVKELSTVEKNNILLIGPSGCGKTYLVETLAKILDIPMISVNATEFTATGYMGKSVSQIGKYLIEKADGDIEKAERGIVFIDEVDKLAASKEEKRDVGCLEVQKELLKVIEGEKLYFNQDSQDFFDEYDEEYIDTHNILFIFSGAFEFLKEKRVKVGFKEQKEEDSKEITPELLINNGFLKEFIGRIPIITELEELTIDDIVDILTNTENNLLTQYKKLFAYDGIELEFDHEAVVEIASLAYHKKIGARGLKAILGNIMNKLLFDIYDKKTAKITITKEMVSSLTKKNNKTLNAKI